MRTLLRAFVAAMTLLWAGGAAAQAPAGLTVFAAASLKNALDEVDTAYARSRGGVPVTASFAASSTLARQIEQGAPADVFVSADVDWMDYVAQRRLIRPGTRANLLTNNLALIAGKQSGVKLSVGRNMPIAVALGAGRLAMAGPDVPAGRYGRAALSALGVWESVKGRTALGENVRARPPVRGAGRGAAGDRLRHGRHGRAVGQDRRPFPQVQLPAHPLSRRGRGSIDPSGRGLLRALPGQPRRRGDLQEIRVRQP